ncbi:CBASS cGAMP synthase [uncultured Winogradskyella sp.]|uniref:CBASS cGAMP synthase n=1 Tax=uncultured Winogradskyella sp. TaxID=395353 RepID=UPI002625ADB5|nr:CBASS cGAMP synthase [uncultured Winogradskyella sp.]
MANNHEQFIEFNQSIKLDDNKKKELRKNRNALRDKIKKHFNDNKPNEVKPKFSAQGSFMMNTIVNPLPNQETDDDGNTKDLYPYDLDDGVYFIDELDNRKSTSTYHNWIYDAVKDHTSKGAIKKNTCVRVLYADGHHIDLPIYFKEIESDGEKTIPYLAHKSEGYVKSDPRKFYKWFNKDAEKQLKRITRYFKAWRDKQNKSYSTKMPSGIVLSILAKENFCSDERDDIAFRDTLKEIKRVLDIEYRCERPTTKKGEDLIQKYSENHFKDRLKKLIESADAAIEHKNPKEACKKWQKHLGDRFSCSNVEDSSKNESKSYSEPAVFNVNAGSA